jgi:hypothetical protein
VGPIGNIEVDSMTDTQHVAYGLHSNIPWCCIKFFITEWPRLVASFGGAHNRDPNTSYVRCPKCMVMNRWVKVHWCTRECKPLQRKFGLMRFYETNELSTSARTAQT